MNSRKFMIIGLTLLLGFVTACTASQPTAGPEPTLQAEFQRPPALSVRAATKLMPHDHPGWNGFGDAVALSGDTAVVGASDWNGPPGTQSGAAYVYQCGGATWTEQAKLTASDADADYQYDERFGQSVAISGDTLVVGAPKADDPTVGDNCGAVYVFQRSGETWTEQAKLTASDAAAGHEFGYAVATSEDTVVVTRGHSSKAIYVFQRDGIAWTEQARLTASDATTDEWHELLGGSIAISGDTLAFGASFGLDADKHSKASAVYIFQRSGTTWTEQSKLTASDTTANNAFGRSVAIKGDIIVVGARGDADGGLGAGAAYVFQRDGNTWTEQAKLTASDATAMNGFGISVAIEGDTVVIGVGWSTDMDFQAAWVFQRSGNTWFDQLKLTGSSDMFGGIPVAISGNAVLIGAPGEFGHAAHVYELTSE